MRLLLTRVAADASRTRVALEARGHMVVVSPLLAIVATGASWPEGAISALLATSGQAFAMAPDPVASRYASLPLYLVGQRTEQAARRRGFDGPSTHAPDAAALIKLIPPERDPSHRFVYLAGRDRKPDLEAALAARRQAVAVVETYEARATGALTDEALVALQDGRIDAALHFSRRSAVLFLQAAERAGLCVTGLPHFCLSEDVAGALRDAACERLKTAKAPNEAALFSLLDRAEG